MEGVRLGPRGLAEAVERAASKLARILQEAEARTPPSVASRQLVEEARRLAQGLASAARILREECGASAAK